MSNSLDKLRSIEMDVLGLGDQLSTLFDHIHGSLNGKIYSETNDKVFNLEDILNQITQTRENMHKQVEEIYTDKNYPLMNRIENDLIEKEHEIPQIREYLNEMLNIKNKYNE